MLNRYRDLPTPSPANGSQPKQRNHSLSLLLSVLGTFLVAVPAEADMRCGMALQQLQGYAQRVNMVVNTEYYQGIPMRCGMNPYCQQALLAQLNQWYMQQAGMVNTWYQQIAMACSSGSPGQLPGSQTSEIGGGINTDVIEELSVDDEDRTVKITIPKNPKGFKK